MIRLLLRRLYDPLFWNALVQERTILKLYLYRAVFLQLARVCPRVARQSLMYI